MFKIEDGREQLFQWDTDRRLIVRDAAITEVHFCNRTDECSLVCETYVENGQTLVNVPNILLQTDWRINVYAYDKNYTKHYAVFNVVKRTKPADYVYTETEVLNYNTLLEMINNIEGGNVDLSDYYTKEETDDKFTGYFDKDEIIGMANLLLDDIYTKQEVDEALKEKADCYNISYWEGFEITPEDKAVIEEAARRASKPMGNYNTNFIIFNDRYFPFIGFEFSGNGDSYRLRCETPTNQYVMFNMTENYELLDTVYPMPIERDYATKEYVDDAISDISIDPGSIDVFVGAGMPDATVELVEGCTGWTAVEIINKDLLMSKLTMGAGDYYLGTNSGSFMGYLKYGSTTGTTIGSYYHLGSIESNIGIKTTGNYTTGYNWIKIIYNAGAAGVAGFVPAPEAGTQDTKWLNSDGTWKEHFPMSGVGENSEIFNYSGNIADGQYSHAEGYLTETTSQGKYSHAEGYRTYASGQGAHAEGYGVSKLYAMGNGSHIEGYGSSVEARGYGSHIEGYKYIKNMTVSDGGDGSHFEGYHDTYFDRYMANGKGCHVEGYNTRITASAAQGAHVEGGYTVAFAPYQHVEGKYNIIDEGNFYLHIAGNGSAETARANAYTLDWAGNATYAGTITSASGADYAEYFEWADGNPEAVDRVGYIVKLNGDKIEFANADDDVLGVISGTMTVLGDNAEWHWQGKYLTDDFGRVIYEYKEEFGTRTNEETGEEETISLGKFPVPKINPEYDESKPYTNRKERPEWDAVGMMGKLYVRDDGTAKINGYVVAVNGIATAAEGRTNMRVMERVADNIIRICLK